MSDELMNDSKFGRLFIIMILAMVGLTISLMVFASLSASGVNEKLQAEKDIERSATLNQELAPVGNFSAEAMAEPIAQAAPAKELTAEDIYTQSCSACHATGAAGAPTVGDADAWSARIAQGNDTLYDHAINGFNGMIARGGNADLTDDQVKAVVDYMVAQSK